MTHDPHHIAPTGHTGSFSRSSAHKKFSQQSPEWFDLLGMAKKHQSLETCHSFSSWWPTPPQTSLNLLSSQDFSRHLSGSGWSLFLHTGGASWPSHVFLLFSSEFTKTVLHFKVHVINNRRLFSLSSPSSFLTRIWENYTHATRCAPTQCAHQWSFKNLNIPFLSRVKKNPGTQVG